MTTSSDRLLRPVNAQRAERGELVAQTRFVEQGVAYVDADEKPILAGAFESLRGKERVRKLGQAGQNEEQDHTGQGSAENAHLEGDGNEGGHRVGRLASHVERKVVG